ncbi:E3 ubiquitin-protein ligase TRIM71-like [Dysidea avara]|uniref:E3 ubiquitin-protein ligase TRIM71-like n=1 Tax=Dysidea avara TaxID=196820 RepID=UPI00331BE547
MDLIRTVKNAWGSYWWNLTGDVKSLPNNFFINRRLHEVALQKVARAAREEETKCDHCAGKENLAVVLCRDCGTLLCDYCYGYHKNSKEYQNHNVTSLDELQSEGISLKASVAMCQEHDIELNFYCETCEQLVCHYCITKTHHDHNHDTVKKMAEKHRKELDKVMEPVQEMVDGLLAACKIVYDIIDEIETKTSTVEKEIDKYFEWLQQQLQQQKEELKKELHGASVQKKKELSLQQRQLEGIKVELESVKELNDTMKKGSGQDTLLMRKEVIDDMKRLSDCHKKMDTEPVELAAMEFVPVRIYEESLPRFGKIYTTDFEVSVVKTYALEGKVTRMSKFTVAPKNDQRCFEVDQMHAQAHTMAGCINPTKINLHKNGLYSFLFTSLPVGEMSLSVTIKGKEVKGSPFSVVVGRNYTHIDWPTKIFNADGQIGQPWGIAFSRIGTWAVADDSNHCIWIFDSYDELITKIGTKGDNASQFQRPLGIAFDSSNNLYVVDHYNHRVQKFDINGCFLLQFGNEGSTNEKLYYPIGIAVHKGRVYVTDSRVSVFDYDGLFCDIIGSPQQLQHPYGVVCINDRLLVADWGHHSIFCFTLSGECVGKIGSQGADKGQLNRPSSLTTDTCGFIFVTEDYNSRVSVFDRDGGCLHCFGAGRSKNDQLLNPKGIAISPCGAIYVSDYNNRRIQIFSKY